MQFCVRPGSNLQNNADKEKLPGAKFIIKNSDGKLATVDLDKNDKKFTGWSEAPAGDNPTYETNTVFVTDANGIIELNGLDAGTYTLTEIEAPANYKMPADPNTTIEIEATHTEGAEGTSATATLTAQKDGTATVVNSKISNLPETGGMGTTMLYGAGAVLVLGATVAFITNKRMKRED